MKISGSRLRRARRRLAARRHQPDGSFRFGARLFATALLTFAVIGVTGYVLLEQHLAHSQIANYAAGVRADAKGFEELGARAGSPAQATRAIDRFLSTVEARPGRVNAFLIDPQRVIVAAGRASSIGSRDAQDLNIRAALAHWTSYFGREIDPTEDHHNFEFVVPLNLPGGQFGRHVYEVTYDHHEGTVQFLRAIADYTLDPRMIIQGGQGFGLGCPSARVPSQPPDILRSGPLVV